MSFFNELKRRNVFRVGVAYIVAGWLLLQVADVLVPMLGLPEITGKVLFTLLAIGLLPALLFAWAFEITADGLQRDSGAKADSVGHHTARRLDRVTLAMMLLVATLVVYDRLVPAPAGDRNAAPPAGAATATSPDHSENLAPASGLQDLPSVAVLPFANMSPDPDNEYFADGISEELLNLLVELDGLRVPSRTSSFAFKGQNRDIREIARELRVNHVLEGSVRKAGSRVRITAQLIDVDTDTHLWSQTYDRELEDIFAIQDEIAGKIIEALKVALELEVQQPPTQNLDAYTDYLQARELLRRRDADNLLQADELLRGVTAADPEFAEAWAALATVQILLPGYVKEKPDSFTQSGRKYAERALDLDPGNVDASLALGLIQSLQGNRGAALERFEKTIAQHPRQVTARLWISILLFMTGYIQEAFEHILMAAELDPVNATVLDWLARIAHAAGAAEQVLEPADRALQLGRSIGLLAILYHFLEHGSFADLAPYLGDRDQAGWPLWTEYAFKLRDQSLDIDQAMAWADQAEQDGAGFATQYWRAEFLLLAGPSDAFFSKIREIQAVDDALDSILWRPGAKRHRQSPQMQQWAAQAGMIALWRERGWPDLCRPISDDDFECD